MRAGTAASAFGGASILFAASVPVAVVIGVVGDAAYGVLELVYCLLIAIAGAFAVAGIAAATLGLADRASRRLSIVGLTLSLLGLSASALLAHYLALSLLGDLDETTAITLMLLGIVVGAAVYAFMYWRATALGCTPIESAYLAAVPSAIVFTAALWVYDRSIWALVVGPLVSLAGAGRFSMLHSFSVSDDGERLRQSVRRGFPVRSRVESQVGPSGVSGEQALPADGARWDDSGDGAVRR